jgi:hypothetical protein
LGILYSLFSVIHFNYYNLDKIMHTAILKPQRYNTLAPSCFGITGPLSWDSAVVQSSYFVCGACNRAAETSSFVRITLLSVHFDLLHKYYTVRICRQLYYMQKSLTSCYVQLCAPDDGPMKLEICRNW